MKEYKINKDVDKADEIKKRVEKAEDAWTKSNNEKKIKQCLYPDHSNCAGKIVKAHAIQNNRVLSQISVNGEVYMPKVRATDPFAVFTKYGKGQATTFSGFCGYHDVTLFKPIEKDKFNNTPEEIFLYTYRTLTSQLHAKSEAVNQQDILGKNLTDYDMELKKGYRMGEGDLYDDKSILDKYILDSEKGVRISPVEAIVWKFDENIDFAGSCYFSPDFDFDGKKIQDIMGSTIAHLYINIFPDNGMSYCVISWLKNFHKVLEKYVQKLKGLSLDEKKNYLNHILVINTDNLVLSPRLIGKFNKSEKDNFGMMSQGMSILEAMFPEDSNASSYLSGAGYSLFE